MPLIRGADGRPRQLTIVAIVAVFVLVAVSAYWLATSGPGARLISPPGSAAAEFSGTGDATTRSFQVRGGWRIVWESSGSRFTLAIRGEGGAGPVVDVAEPASGVVAPAGSGTFHMEVSTDGPWSATVQQGE